jgi:predicted AlkP superfamily pyrophosphatase or phosphodiesterase
MTRRFLTPAGSMLLCTMLLVLTGTSGSGLQTPPGAPHVVLISLDGFAGWAMDDPHLPVPTLRRLARTGAIARDGMRPVNPTVTWPNHTSMVSGVSAARHRLLFNGLLIREPGVPPRIEPWRDRHEMVHARTLYDVAHEQGLTTAQVDWVAIQNAPTVTWEFAERPDPASRIPREMVAAGLITREDVETFHTRNIVWRDHIWTEAATHILRQHRPNFLMFHVLNLDSTQHRYGPRSPAATSAMALADTQVEAIMRTLDETGLAPRTTVFVVSDHGFKTVRRHVRPNAAFMKAGLLQVEGDKVTRAEAYAMSVGGSAMVYVTGPDPSGAVLARAKQALTGTEGIASIVEAADFARHGLPHPDTTDQVGLLWLTPEDGYAFTTAVGDEVVVDTAPTSLGAHGYPASDPDLRALFIASGRAVRPGVTIDTVSTLDLAPTMARLLGIELKAVEGRILTEILDEGGF